MKFWDKFWKLVSKRYLVFGVLLFAAVIALTLFDSANKVQVAFSEDAVDITSSRYSMNIPYDMVASVELADMPDRGEVVNGTDDMTIRTGTWQNETWGEYFICADLDATNCIVVRLNDGRIFVFSRRSSEETAGIYETFQTYLS